MFRILVPVDGSETSTRVVEFLLRKLDLYKEQAEIHLLNVQPALHYGFSSFVSREQVARFHHEQGIEALAGARAKLDAVRVPYQFHIGVGDDPAQVIAHYVRDKRCDQVLMGTRGLGALAGMLLGSVATKVIHLVEVPVLLVK